MQVTVTSGPDSGKRLLLYPGQQYYIGRDPAYCQLILTDLQISRKHVIVSLDDNSMVVIADNCSQNGTFLNGSAISSPVVVKPGDLITLGSTNLSVDYSEALPDNFTSWQSEPVCAISVSTPGTVITIGRDPSNKLTLPHPHVSRFHAAIETTPAGTFIRDLSSTNGTFVNGIRITGQQPLNHDSIIRINGFRLTLDDHQLVRHDETAGQVEIDVRELSKVVPLPDGTERVLLNNLNYRIEPREFVAILGGSGAGKTTLLKAMMGTWPASYGEILINGEDYYDNYSAFKTMVGYVPQDDIVHMDLTVEEVLNYAARLRMPDDTLPDERIVRVEQVMQSLGLSERRSLLVKNLSGGQRKRVSIGVELITMPSIMFLDEPTSGLDPGLEKVMMEMMRNMANQGQTIFLVTHATFNIHLCDKLIFLTEGGRLAFFGSPQEALSYFGTEDFAEIYKMINLDGTPDDWQYKYNSSEFAHKYRSDSKHDAKTEHYLSKVTSRKSAIRQWYDLTCRYAHTVLRDRKSFTIMVLQPFIIAALLCLVFIGSIPVFDDSPFQTEDLVITDLVLAEGRLDELNANVSEEQRRERDMTFVILATVLTAIWSGASNSAREIIKEIVIYKRERFVMIRIAPYLMSKIIVLAAICLAQGIIFISILYIVLGLPYYWLNVLAFYLIALSSAIMGLSVSAVASNTNVATATLPILLIPQLFMAGAIIPIHEIEPEFLHNIFYLIVGKWGYELIGGEIININNLLAFEWPIKALDGSFQMHWFALICFCFAFYVISSLALLRKDRDLS